MKTKAISLLVTLSAALIAALCPAAVAMADGSGSTAQPSKTKFEIKRGVNIAHWVSQTGARGEERARIFTERDVEQLAAWGFDHIRIPVGEEQLFSPDGTMDNETMTLIETAIGWCKKHDMRAIFDLHNLRSHHFNEKNNTLWTSPEAQQRLCDMWEKIARRLDKFPVTLLAYELLNEPVADKNEEWNKVLAKLLPVVRDINKKRVILVPSNKWDSVDNIPDVAIPDNDKNIILTFHFYEPFILTHYRASWTDQKDIVLEHGVKYPGRPVDPEDVAKLDERQQKIVGWWATQNFDTGWLRARWKRAVDFARRKGLALYLGEFGCLHTVSQEARVAWTGDITAMCNEYGIPRAYWEYKSGFGFADWNTGKLTNPELLKAITQ